MKNPSEYADYMGANIDTPTNMSVRMACSPHGLQVSGGGFVVFPTSPHPAGDAPKNRQIMRGQWLILATAGFNHCRPRQQTGSKK